MLVDMATRPGTIQADPTQAGSPDDALVVRLRGIVGEGRDGQRADGHPGSKAEERRFHGLSYSAAAGWQTRVRRAECFVTTGGRRRGECDVINHTPGWSKGRGRGLSSCFRVSFSPCHSCTRS